MTNSLTVVRAGALTTVQDLGRRGFAHLAVPRGGAADVPAMRLANRLVGNPEDSAVLETTVNGVAVRVAEACHVAVAGALSPVQVGSRLAGWGVPVPVRPGDIVDIGRAERGVRAYLAISGGIAVEPVLGSRSTDILAGIGPDVLRDGSTILVGPDRPEPAYLDFAPYPLARDELDVDCYLGPRDSCLTAAAVELLSSVAWTVNPQSNRIALRLDGPALRWRTGEELQSEGVVLGSVQVPPDGKPVVFLTDHPTTGGYPVVGVVPAPDIWRCGQARPGTRIRLRARRVDPLLPGPAADAATTSQPR